MSDQFYGFDVPDLLEFREVLLKKNIDLKDVIAMVREDEYELGILRGQLTIAEAKFEMIKKVLND